MSENQVTRDDRPDDEPDERPVRPLPGEPGIPNVAAPPTVTVSKKGLLAVGLLLVSLVAVLGVSIARFATGTKEPEHKQPLAAERPSAATTEPKRLDVAVLPVRAASSAPLVPAIDPKADTPAEPIGVRRNGPDVSPEDAPVLLASSRSGLAGPIAMPQGRADAAADPLEQTRRNLQAYERQLRGMMESPDPAGGDTNEAGPSRGLLSSLGGATRGGLFGGQLEGSGTPKVAAGLIGDRSLTLPKGTAFTCALKTKVISATSGLVGCQVLRNVYGDDGRVLLVERGSHLDGEYRIASVRPGMVRVPVLWTRVRTPNGVTVDLDSPATGQLGESGIDGHVDNRWGERIGAALLLSLIDDSVQMVIQNQTEDRNADTIVLPSTTAGASKLAEKVLDSTINIPPLIYRNQGGIVGVYVARDVDFSSVYELRPTETVGAR